MMDGSFMIYYMDISCLLGYIGDDLVEEKERIQVRDVLDSLLFDRREIVDKYNMITDLQNEYFLDNGNLVFMGPRGNFERAFNKINVFSRPGDIYRFQTKTDFTFIDAVMYSEEAGRILGFEVIFPKKEKFLYVRNIPLYEAMKFSKYIDGLRKGILPDE